MKVKILFAFAEETFLMPTHTKIPKRWTYFVEIASYIKRAYDDVTLMDCLSPAISHGEVLQKVANSRYDVVCCIARSETTRSLIKLIPLIKHISPTTKVLVYGDLVNLAPRFFKASIPSADYFVLNGDWEVGILEYLRQVENGGKRNQLLCSSSPNTRKSSADGSYSSSFINWEFPNVAAQGFADCETYLALTKGELTLSVSRGCPYGCSFCPAVMTFGKIDRRKSPEEIVAYMKAHRHYVNSYKLFSPTFTGNKQWVETFCNALLTAECSVPWSATTRPDCLQDVQLIGLMKKAGCYKLAVGIETLDEASNRKLRKFADITRYKQSVETLIHATNAVGIDLKPLLMIGIKGQTRNTIMEMLTFLSNHGLKNLRVAAYSPKHLLTSKDRTGKLTIDDIERLDKMTFINEHLPGINEHMFLNLIYNTANYHSILA